MTTEFCLAAETGPKTNNEKRISLDHICIALSYREILEAPDS